MRYDISLLFLAENSIQQTDQKSTCSQDVALQIAALHWLHSTTSTYKSQPGQFCGGMRQLSWIELKINIE